MERAEYAIKATFLESCRSKSAYLLIGWPIYFVMYLITEQIPIEKCHVVHCALDDLIPFNEYFVVFYCAWYVLIFGSLLYFFICDTKSFEQLQIFIIITQVIAIITYIIYPTVQIGRPEIMNDNIFCSIMAWIYSVDTPTGVCPSLHVAYSLGVISVWTKKRGVSTTWKTFIVIMSVMICVSVLFVKQHSAIDVATAIIVGMAAECITRR